MSYVGENLPDCTWTRNIAIGIEEIGMIENIRYVPAELKREPLCQLGVLIEANVVRVISRTLQNIHSAVAKPALRWDGKGRRIKPMIEFALARR